MKYENAEIVRVVDIRQKAISMLELFISILKKHEVQYWIVHGTLLGAVRHVGPIPWDSEFDLGVWFDEVEHKVEDIILDLELAGFFVVMAPDRIKASLKGWTVGAFTIDMHLYKRADELVYISFARRKSMLKSPILTRLYSYIWHLGENSEPVYRYQKFVKAIIANGYSVPEEFEFARGVYEVENSFRIHFDGNKIISDPMQGAGLLKRCVARVFSFLPSRLRSRIIDILHQSITKSGFTAENQYYPRSLFDQFVELPFCGLSLSAPANYTDYLDYVYRSGWRAPDMKWNRGQMKHMIDE